MSREFQDSDFRVWEVYASTGDFGFSERSRLVFHCVTEPSLRARVLKPGADKSEVEQLVVRASEDELRSLFERAQELK